MLFLRSSGSRLGKHIVTYGLHKNNRVGSDELINCPSLSASTMSRAGSGSVDDLLLFASVERLRQQLMEKEQTIARLRRQLREAAISASISVSASASASVGAITSAPRPDQSNPSGFLQRFGHRLSRSTSVRSISAWFSRRLSTVKVSPPVASVKRRTRCRSNPLECITDSRSAVSEGGEAPRHYEQFSYEQLMTKVVSRSDLHLSRLERHLEEESLLEYMAICEDFLVFLDPTEVEERKYKVMLTSEQYRHL